MHTMNNELDPATVFTFGIDLEVLMFHGIETQPYKADWRYIAKD